MRMRSENMANNSAKWCRQVATISIDRSIQSLKTTAIVTAAEVSIAVVYARIMSAWLKSLENVSQLIRYATISAHAQW